MMNVLYPPVSLARPLTHSLIYSLMVDLCLVCFLDIPKYITKEDVPVLSERPCLLGTDIVNVEIHSLRSFPDRKSLYAIIIFKHTFRLRL